MKRLLIISGLVIFGTWLATLPGIFDLTFIGNWGIFWLSRFAIIFLTGLLAYRRAWLPLLISLVAIWQGLAMMGGTMFSNLMWPILFFVPMGLFVWLLVRKAWWLSAFSLVVILTGLAFIG